MSVQDFSAANSSIILTNSTTLSIIIKTEKVRKKIRGVVYFTKSKNYKFEIGGGQ